MQVPEARAILGLAERQEPSEAAIRRILAPCHEDKAAGLDAPEKAVMAVRFRLITRARSLLIAGSSSASLAPRSSTSGKRPPPAPRRTRAAAAPPPPAGPGSRPAHAAAPLPLPMLPHEEQKSHLGSRLHAQLEAAGMDNAEALTSRLLELDNAELLRLLESPRQLHSRVRAALPAPPPPPSPPAAAPAQRETAAQAQLPPPPAPPAPLAPKQWQPGDSCWCLAPRTDESGTEVSESKGDYFWQAAVVDKVTPKFVYIDGDADGEGWRFSEWDAKCKKSDRFDMYGLRLR
eukprot:gene6522-23304_t